MDVKKGTGTDLYNLDFSIQGKYAHITTFITNIENDSKLSFRIYNFKLVPGSDDINLKATFTVKDVNIDDSSLIKSSSSLENTSGIDKGITNSSNTTTQTDGTSENNTQNPQQ